MQSPEGADIAESTPSGLDGHSAVFSKNVIGKMSNTYLMNTFKPTTGI